MCNIACDGDGWRKVTYREVLNATGAIGQAAGSNVVHFLVSK
jgi:hypothetical protein